MSSLINMENPLDPGSKYYNYIVERIDRDPFSLDEAGRFITSRTVLHNLINRPGSKNPSRLVIMQNSEKRIGSGAVAIIRVLDTYSNRICAAKFALNNIKDPNSVISPANLLRREAGILYQLQSPNIAKYIDYIDNVTHCPHVEMLITQHEFCTFGEINFINIYQLQQFLTKAYEALNFAHNYGIYHFDIKASNYLFGNGIIPVLADWEAAYNLNERINPRLGTNTHIDPMALAVVSPSQELCMARDTYAFACMFLSMCYETKNQNERKKALIHHLNIPKGKFTRGEFNFNPASSLLIPPLQNTTNQLPLRLLKTVDDATVPDINNRRINDLATLYNELYSTLDELNKQL